MQLGDGLGVPREGLIEVARQTALKTILTAQETNSAEADIYAEPSISKGSAHVERAHALSSTYPHSESAAARKNGDLVRRYVIAEDLALRAIQVQYEATLNRQITWGRDNGFDGAFAKDGRLHVVEVKYVSNGGSELPLRRAAKRLASAIQGYGWKSVTILLVAVYENANDMPGPTLSDAPAILGYPVKLHRYSIEQLKANFEAIDSDVEAQ